MVLIVLVLVVTSLLALADVAVAWGPVTHLAHGSEVLKNLTILGVGLQQLLTRHRREYLYGCIGADITLGKKYTREMQAHCHSWEVGWRVLEAAESDAERAFAYGYLTHLAADVFSHNHYIPTQLIVSFRARTLRHIYWEARFDTMQDPGYRQLITDVRGFDLPECDRLVKRVVSRTLFSFRTNKRIFDSVLAFHDWKNWHDIIHQMSHRSQHQLPAEMIARYNAACLGNITEVLVHGHGSSCQQADPTGLQALTLAKDVRRKLKALRRRGGITPDIEARLQELNQRLDLSASSLARGISPERA